MFHHCQLSPKLLNNGAVSYFIIPMVSNSYQYTWTLLRLLEHHLFSRTLTFGCRYVVLHTYMFLNLVAMFIHPSDLALKSLLQTSSVLKPLFQNEHHFIPTGHGVAPNILAMYWT